jgi:hypothetical protein
MDSPPQVNWIGRAHATGLTKRLEDQFGDELNHAFADQKPFAITVYECFTGYADNLGEKVILAVEVASPAGRHTHIVKLGTPKEVGRDFTGWEACQPSRRLTSRIFVSVKLKELLGGRVAVIYQDAFTLFPTDDETGRPMLLEALVRDAVLLDQPVVTSVERILIQIYGELNRWFYQDGRVRTADARAFYHNRLQNAPERWAGEPRLRELRRDAVWLLGGTDPPDSREVAVYLDPCDYLAWALASDERLPPTLVGGSHGDLHGKNVLACVQRGEAEGPAVFDYGSMRPDNVLAWDFVKLETELKVRILPKLFDDPEARKALRGPLRRGAPEYACPALGGAAAHVAAARDRAERLAFAFHFEQRLAERTHAIQHRSHTDNREPPGGRHVTGHAAVDRALGVFLRIRQEAGQWLSYRRPQRPAGQWKDEYYFALAAFATSTAKWPNYPPESAECALVSGGVAVAQLEGGQDAFRRLTNAPPAEGPHPSYRVPLYHGYRLWKRRSADARDLLGQAAAAFPHAVPLAREHALALLEAGRDRDVAAMLDGLRELCPVFGDYETLSRLGRVFKMRGDQAWRDYPVPLAEDEYHPALRNYQHAFDLYREAFGLCRGYRPYPRSCYYPGGNAATLARLLGRAEEADRLAREVLEVCRDHERVDEAERYWLLVSAGEAALVAGRVALAVGNYRQAVLSLDASQLGMTQTTYDQVCRLGLALGHDVVRPVAEVFWANVPDLTPGPLGDCGRAAGA